jgi:hypothetical protein
MRIRPTLPPAVAILIAVFPLAAATHTIDGLVRLVRDAVQRNESDGDLARALHRLELDQGIDDRTAEELESLAPGPTSIAELERQREVTHGQRLPKVLPQFASPPEPTPDELRGVLEAARRKALVYTAGLPDFICTETVRRYEWHYQSWTLIDTLTLQLTFFEHAEKYKLTLVNGRETKRTYDQVSGAWSRGEFGSMLLDVFAPASLAPFKWSNWTTLRRRPAYVLSFQIDARNSRYSLSAQKYDRSVVSALVGEHGMVYIDRETKDVMRLDIEADSIPKSLPMEAATRSLDYGPADVGGRSFLLPLRADVRMAPRYYPSTRNEVEFTGYRKFTGESSITFEDSAAPPPEGKK